MQRLGSPKTFPLVIMALALVVGVVFIMTMAAFTMSWGMGGWGMGGGHMQRMMGGGTDSSNAPPAVGGQSESVSMRDFAFTPGNLQVPVGAKVTWTNYDDAPHTATAKDGSWDTGILNKSDTKTLSFDKAGGYTYFCAVHPSMVARLTVQ